MLSNSYDMILAPFLRKKRIVYLVPHLNISGGIIIVLQHVVRLKHRGYDAYVINLSGRGDAKWFPCIDEVKIVNFKHEPSREYKNIDVLIATSWDTTEALQKLLPAKRKLYFVQSDERRFTDDIDVQKKIQETYRTDCEYVTEAIWIQRWLREEFHHNAYYVPNGLDESIIYKTKPLTQKTKKFRVLLEGPINIPFKGMQDAYNAIKDLDCELWIVSSGGEPPSNWRYDKFFENVPMKKMKEIYSSCDIFLKMSRVEGFFGPPMEAMTCGCAVVVGECTGYDEYIKHEYNALVVEQGDVKSARQAMKRLMDDEALRKKLITNGEKTAKEWSWNYSIDLLEKVVKGKFPEVYYTDNFPQRYEYEKVF